MEEIRTGDIVQVKDGSYSLRIGGYKLEETGNLVKDCAGPISYEVLQADMKLPTSGSTLPDYFSVPPKSEFNKGLYNDTIIRPVGGDTTIFTQSRFLRLVLRCRTCQKCGAKISP